MLSTDQRLSCMGSMHLLVAGVLVLERVTCDFVILRSAAYRGEAGARSVAKPGCCGTLLQG